MLSSALPNKTSIYEVNGSPITKHLGFLVIKFEDFNCTAECYRSPNLVIQGHAPVQKGFHCLKNCYFQEGVEVKMNITVENAYFRSIETVVDWIGSEVNTSRTYALFRTYAPVHFRFNRGGDLEFWWGLSHGSSARLGKLDLLNVCPSQEKRLYPRTWKEMFFMSATEAQAHLYYIS
ncbi:unnamed protein product [Prunus brigantina]